ncbi:hypothetical protein BJV82DRAFT_592562 [Fennellomyces sp. T-0311]|nr:hypothetical protein BJV82DRAFT_592562 [Fennellomyces sp. T-0311]
MLWKLYKADQRKRKALNRRIMSDHHQQADYSAIPPANSRKAPWQHHREPDLGVSDPWNRSKDAVVHPEYHNTAHGTVDTADEKIALEHNDHHHDREHKTRKTKQHQEPAHNESMGVFGHTVHGKRSPQSFVKRDLDNI